VQHSVPGGRLLDLDLRMSGGTVGRLRVRLAGSPLDGGGLSLTGSQVVLDAATLPTVLSGRIDSLQGTDFTATVGTGAGALKLRANLQVPSGSGPVTGQLTGTGVRGGG
jgi:hypothetical protein